MYDGLRWDSGARAIDPAAIMVRDVLVLILGLDT